MLASRSGTPPCQSAGKRQRRILARPAMRAELIGIAIPAQIEARAGPDLAQTQRQAGAARDTQEPAEQIRPSGRPRWSAAARRWRAAADRTFASIAAAITWPGLIRPGLPPVEASARGERRRLARQGEVMHAAEEAQRQGARFQIARPIRQDAADRSAIVDIVAPRDASYRPRAASPARRNSRPGGGKLRRDHAADAALRLIQSAHGSTGSR